MKKIYSLLLPVLCALPINAVPAGVPLWQVLGLTDDSVITTESKLDHISLEFSGVFTALQNITDIVVSDVSKLDDFKLIINTSFAVSQLDAISSGIDVVQSLVDSLEGCGASGAISQSDVGTSGYTISSAGSYFLTENITFNPLVTGQVAITINASNVYLDLNGFTITQGNNIANTGGVEVSAGRRNIKILNGIIRNMRGETIATGSNVNNVYVSGIQALSAGLPGGGSGGDAANGISVGGGRNYVFNNVTVTNAQDEGFDLNFTFNFIVKNSTASYNLSAGIHPDNSSSQGVIADCVIERNRSYGVFSAFPGNPITNDIVVVRSVIFQNAQSGIITDNRWIIEDCDILNNGGTGDSGINLNSTGSSSVVKNNTIIGNVMGVDFNGADNFVFRNTLIQNGSNNIPAPTAANSVLGNYAFNTTDAANYVSGGGTTINRTVVNTTGSFATQPVFWRNVSAIP